VTTCPMCREQTPWVTLWMDATNRWQLVDRTGRATMSSSRVELMDPSAVGFCRNGHMWPLGMRDNTLVIAFGTVAAGKTFLTKDLSRCTPPFNSCLVRLSLPVITAFNNSLLQDVRPTTMTEGTTYVALRTMFDATRDRRPALSLNDYLIAAEVGGAHQPDDVHKAAVEGWGSQPHPFFLGMAGEHGDDAWRSVTGIADLPGEVVTQLHRHAISLQNEVDVDMFAKMHALMFIIDLLSLEPVKSTLEFLYEGQAVALVHDILRNHDKVFSGKVHEALTENRALVEDTFRHLGSEGGLLAEQNVKVPYVVLNKADLVYAILLKRRSWAWPPGNPVAKASLQGMYEGGVRALDAYAASWAAGRDHTRHVAPPVADLLHRVIYRQPPDASRLVVAALLDAYADPDIFWGFVEHGDEQHLTLLNTDYVVESIDDYTRSVAAEVQVQMRDVVSAVLCRAILALPTRQPVDWEESIATCERRMHVKYFLTYSHSSKTTVFQHLDDAEPQRYGRSPQVAAGVRQLWANLNRRGLKAWR